MLVRRFVPLALVLSLLAAVALAPAGAAAGPSAAASKKAKGKGGKCPKGKKQVTVTKHGHKIKKCVKKGKKPGPTPSCRTATASCALPPPPLFDPPGKKLVGNEATPFLEKYLLNSTFTDCPAGWPNCAVEHRYSHTSGGFYYCRLTSAPGADIINGAKNYQVQNVVVEPDGSWTFNEQVENSGGPSFYEWHVATNGVVNGAYQFNYGPIEAIGPLQYLHQAKDCSY
jgi:hypothetical protein